MGRRPATGPPRAPRSRPAARGAIEPPPAIVDIAPTVLRHLGIAIEPKWGLDGKAVGLKAAK